MEIRSRRCSTVCSKAQILWNWMGLVLRGSIGEGLFGQCLNLWARKLLLWSKLCLTNWSLWICGIEILWNFQAVRLTSRLKFSCIFFLRGGGYTSWVKNYHVSCKIFNSVVKGGMFVWKGRGKTTRWFNWYFGQN